MAEVTIRGATYFYAEQGTGEETIVFSHGFLMNHSMFAPQLEAFSDAYRCIAFDWRGQGNSEATPEGYDMESLYEDAVAFIETLGIAPVHWVGVSMGGFIGIRLAARRPDLIRTLTLAETGAEAETPGKKLRWGLLANIFRLFGPGPVVKPITKILFGRTTLADPAKQEMIERFQKSWFQMNHSALVKTAFAIFQRADVQDLLPQIQAPTLVLVGEEDVARPLEEAKKLQAGIPDARLVVIPEAGHSSPIENPEDFNRALRVFLEAHSSRAQTVKEDRNEA